MTQQEGSKACLSDVRGEDGRKTTRGHKESVVGLSVHSVGQRTLVGIPLLSTRPGTPRGQGFRPCWQERHKKGESKAQCVSVLLESDRTAACSEWRGRWVDYRSESVSCLLKRLNSESVRSKKTACPPAFVETGVELALGAKQLGDSIRICRGEGDKATA